MGAGKDRQADAVHILLNRGRNDLFRGLVQACVDDLKAGIPEGPGDDFCTTVVTVKTRLADECS